MAGPAVSVPAFCSIARKKYIAGCMSTWHVLFFCVCMARAVSLPGASANQICLKRMASVDFVVVSILLSRVNTPNDLLLLLFFITTIYVYFIDVIRRLCGRQEPHNKRTSGNAEDALQRGVVGHTCRRADMA